MSISESVEQITERSFKQTLGTLNFFDNVQIDKKESLQLNSKDYFSVMTTVSTSKFRVIVLLHAPRYKQGGNELSTHMNIDDKGDSNQQYLDHTYEYSNNLCGMCARHIQASGYTTGISQPAILNRAYTDSEVDAISPTYKAHVISTLHGKLSLCSTVCIFVNEDAQDISLQVEDEEEFDDVSGELEFF